MHVFSTLGFYEPTDSCWNIISGNSFLMEVGNSMSKLFDFQELVYLFDYELLGALPCADMVPPINLNPKISLCCIWHPTGCICPTPILRLG